MLAGMQAHQNRIARRRQASWVHFEQKGPGSPSKRGFVIRGEAVTPIVPVPDEQPLVLAFTLPDQALTVALVHEASIGM
jgi:hypothetical protein